MLLFLLTFWKKSVWLIFGTYAQSSILTCCFQICWMHFGLLYITVQNYLYLLCHWQKHLSSASFDLNEWDFNPLWILKNDVAVLNVQGHSQVVANCDFYSAKWLCGAVMHIFQSYYFVSSKNINSNITTKRHPVS